MRRLSLFIGALPWGSRLQMLAMVLILGYWSWLDYKSGHWPVTIGIVVFTWFIGWLLKPLMVAYSRQTFKIWSTFGIAVLLTYVFAQNQWWWHVRAAGYAREFVMWLDLSCGYWFISELRLQQERQIEYLISESEGSQISRNSNRRQSEKDEFGDEREYEMRR